MTSAPTDVSEYDAIARTVQHYIDGAKAGSGEVMRPAFHKDAMCFGYLGSDLIASPIEQMFEGIENMGPATGLKGGITSIDLIGTVATVRLELDDWTGKRFTGVYTLLKIDGEWKMMVKVFHLHS